MTRYAFVAAATLLLAPDASAQQWQAPDLAAQKDAMEAIVFLRGDWEGSGWMQMGPQRSEVLSSERVRPAAGGLAMVVEGVHRAEMPDGTQKVVHDALGVLTWDSESGAYRFATKLATGFGGDYSAAVNADGDLEWSIPVPGRLMRYVIHVENGKWRETGHMSTDGGETWDEFFGMTLTRAGE
jgi:hypothetical protein